jgi:glutaredoxin
MSGFWSLEGAPKWWFDRRVWALFAAGLVAMSIARWHYGPGRVAAGEVVVYGAAWCPYSQALIAHLDASGIPYKDRDIEGSMENFLRYVFAAGRRSSLPVVQVGPRVVAKGFYRAEIDQALVAAGYKPSANAAGVDGASAPR